MGPAAPGHCPGAMLVCMTCCPLGPGTICMGVLHWSSHALLWLLGVHGQAVHVDPVVLLVLLGLCHQLNVPRHLDCSKVEAAAASAEVAGVAGGEVTAAGVEGRPGAQACPGILVLETGHCEVHWKKKGARRLLSWASAADWRVAAGVSGEC